MKTNLSPGCVILGHLCTLLSFSFPFFMFNSLQFRVAQKVFLFAEQCSAKSFDALQCIDFFFFLKLSFYVFVFLLCSILAKTLM